MSFDPSTATLAQPTKKPFDPNTAQEVPQQDVSQPQGSILNPIANAMTFGWGDEAAAGALTAFGIMSGDIPENQAQDAFESIRGGIEDERKAYEEANPGKSLGAEIGTLAVVGLPKIIESLARKGLAGAGMVAGLEGGLYGAGEGGEGFQKGETIVDLPVMDPVTAPIDIPGRVSGGLGTGLAAIPMGVGGAKAFDMLAGKLADTAATRKMVREGVESPDTAGLTLKDPSQRQVIETVETGDIVEDALVNIPTRPQGFSEVASELSPLKPSVVKSPSAERALFQKVAPSTITNIRESNPATRKKLEQITKIHWANLNKTIDTDPFSVVGDEFNKRINKVLEEHDKALTLQSKGRKQLEKVSGPELDGTMDSIANNLAEGLESKLISIDDTGNLDFSKVGTASPLKKPGNRKALNNVFSQLKNARTADDLHVLRKDVDKMLKFEKGGISGGVDEDTDSILKGLRSSIRESLNALSDDYSSANATLSKNLDAIQSLESVMPRLKKMDLSDKNQVKSAKQYMGQQLRKLDSNYANQAELEGIVSTFDDLAKDYGGNYPVDIKRLSRHLGEIKLRLGEGKASGFQDKIEAANRRASDSQGFKGKALDKIMGALDPVKGISDESAYKAILENIAEMNKRERVK